MKIPFLVLLLLATRVMADPTVPGRELSAAVFEVGFLTPLGLPGLPATLQAEVRDKNTGYLKHAAWAVTVVASCKSGAVNCVGIQLPPSAFANIGQCSTDGVTGCLLDADCPPGTCKRSSSSADQDIIITLHWTWSGTCAGEPCSSWKDFVIPVTTLQFAPFPTPGP